MNLNEKIALVLGLLQQRVSIDEQLNLLINDAVDFTQGKYRTEIPITKKHKHTKKNKDNTKGNGKNHRMDEATKEKITKDYEAGKSMNQIAKETGFTFSGIHAFLKRTEAMRGRGGKHRAEYECGNGHQFKSNLAMAVARCPDCGTLAVDYWKDTAVKEN